jgi:tRNA-specific 2-thiouridylase
MKKTVAVALSGGLDSAVAASLLKEDNYKIIGIHFRTGYERIPTESIPEKTQPQVRARHAASTLKIPLEIVDCSQSFSEEVVTYFMASYRTGQTPNPCIVCNQRIKFGVLLKRARALGAVALATGHYARIARTAADRLHLMKGVDPDKDQSYFLCRLTQEQLGQALFPLGPFTKKRVTQMAADRGLAALVGDESQELCFVGSSSYRDFLTGHGQPDPRPGPIVNIRGEVLGHHRGLHGYTIGQRSGMGIPGPEPYFVLRLDMEKNRLVIGTKGDLAATECNVTGINWIGMDPPEAPLDVRTRIRYRHKEALSILHPIDAKAAKVVFCEPQSAITPGQAAVFYDGERVLGGGWIAP